MTGEGPAAMGLAAAALALVELDSNAAGQFMLSRPIVVGPILGLAFAAPATGLELGLLFELFSLEELPVGASLPLNATVAAGSALLLALGPAPVAPELAFPAGLILGWLHRRLESGLRRRRAVLSRRAQEDLGRGERPSLGTLAARELGLQALMTASVFFMVLFPLKDALAAGWSRAPEALRAGLGFGFAAAPWVGAAALLRSLKVGRAVFS